MKPIKKVKTTTKLTAKQVLLVIANKLTEEESQKAVFELTNQFCLEKYDVGKIDDDTDHVGNSAYKIGGILFTTDASNETICEAEVITKKVYVSKC